MKETDVSADPLDKAAMESVVSSTFRIRDRESRLINKIQITLAKIKDGEFGICEACGDDIPLERLTARPVTAYCIECKTLLESWENYINA